MTADARSAAIVAVVAVAPLAIVVIVAMLRGYSIHVQLDRDQHRRKGDDA